MTYQVEVPPRRQTEPVSETVLFLHTFLPWTSLIPVLVPPVRREIVFSFLMHMMARNNMNNIILVPWEKISKSNIESGL